MGMEKWSMNKAVALRALTTPTCLTTDLNGHRLYKHW